MGAVTKRVNRAWSFRLVLAFSMMASFVLSQETKVGQDQPPGAKRPKIALVLSGGGARGFAHIGVLKVLEQLHIPIDLVVGSSMGAVVGGGYAAGLSPEEIENIAVTANWDKIFSDERARHDLPFRRKEDDFRYVTSLDMGFVNGRLILPRGFLAGQKLGLLMARYTLPVAGINNFDQLPVPFRAVATDLVTGKMVVLANGDLALAIRASMTVPTIFTPVEWGDALLVDGGVVAAIPVDVARELGADIVIVVNVGSPLRPREELNSLVGIASQVADVAAVPGQEEQLKRADVVISPDLGNLSPYDFPHASRAIAAGVAAVEKAKAELSRFSVGEDEYAPYLARTRRVVPEAPKIEFVRVEGVVRIGTGVINHMLRTRPGVPFDLGTVEQDVMRLYQLGDFESVTFRLKQEEGRWGVIIQAKEKVWGARRIRFGVNFADDMAGANSFSGLGNFTWSNTNRMGAEWKVDLQVGREQRIFTEFYQPLAFSQTFFSAGWAEQFSIERDDYFDQQPVAQVTTTGAKSGFDLGCNLGRWGELRVGVWQHSVRTRRKSAGVKAQDYSFDTIGLSGRLVIDRLDSVDFPRKGFYAAFSGAMARPGLGSELKYRKASIMASGYSTAGRLTLFATAQGGTAFDTPLPAYDEFSLGGLLSLSGYRDGELRGQYFAVVRAGTYMQVLGPKGWLKQGLLCGLWGEAGNAWQRKGDARSSNLHKTLTVTCGGQTLLGPMYLAMGANEDGTVRSYLSLGHRF